MTGDLGQWDQELYLRFKAASGEPRRRLLGQIIHQNTPLIKTLVKQVCGMAEGKDKRFAGKRKVRGAEQLPWEELMSAGMVAFGTAIEKFDPSKGKIAGFARWRIFYEIQTAYKMSHFVRAPRGREIERPGVTFYDDNEALDRACLDRSAMVDEVHGITADDIDGWDRSGKWPKYEDWVASRRPVQVAVPAGLPMDAVVRFLSDMCVETAGGIAPRAQVIEAFERHQKSIGVLVPIGAPQLAKRLSERGIKKSAVRVAWSESVVTAFAGVRLKPANFLVGRISG